jgi:hypothetical protein
MKVNFSVQSYLLVCLISLFAISCNTSESKKEKEVKTEKKKKKKVQRPISVKNGKFFEKSGRKMLYGGKDSLKHFDITNYDLKDEGFHYGIGREVFPALLKPKFTTIQKADSIWKDDTRFLVAYSGDEVKAYSVKDLTRHEVVNDVLNGEPIMAAYCILADLGAIYDRKYGDKVLTFALSGYTYHDKNVWNGMDGFVLWDRETESLWWPLIDKAVSGSLKGVQLLEKNKSNWRDTTWGEIKKSFPNAKVLISNQDYVRPKSWEKLKDVASIVSNYKKEN